MLILSAITAFFTMFSDSGLLIILNLLFSIGEQLLIAFGCFEIEGRITTVLSVMVNCFSISALPGFS